MYIPELDYHCDLCAETLIEADVFPDWSNLVFADCRKDLKSVRISPPNFSAILSFGWTALSCPIGIVQCMFLLSRLFPLSWKHIPFLLRQS